MEYILPVFLSYVSFSERRLSLPRVEVVAGGDQSVLNNLDLIAIVSLPFFPIETSTWQ